MNLHAHTRSRFKCFSATTKLLHIAPRVCEQGRAAIDSFVAEMDGDRARRTKWNSLAAELDAELKIVKVGDLMVAVSLCCRTSIIVRYASSLPVSTVS